MAGPVPLIIVGVGKIARDQHLPAIEADPDFVLTAGVSRHATVEGVPNFESLEQCLAEGPKGAVVLCVPPKARTEMALQAIAAGRDVMLEKPPAATLGEIEKVIAAAQARGVTLFATWHSRFAPAVPAAKAWLDGRAVKAARINWKEDVRRWHPGQAWIWEPGGFGVCDPGINALSILTEILPGAHVLERARLEVPENCQTPIAASLSLTGPAGFPVDVVFDWRQEGPQSWDIVVETEDGGLLELASGGAEMRIDGVEVTREPEREYPEIYRRFARLIETRESDVDTSPLRIVADAFLLGERLTTDPFHD